MKWIFKAECSKGSPLTAGLLSSSLSVKEGLMLDGRCQQWFMAQLADRGVDVCVVLFISVYACAGCLQRFLLLPVGAFLQDLPVLL